MSREERSHLREALLRFFDGHARDLPWRRTRDPYAIWVSEVMLQQTRVETVIPYFQRFLERFPTVQALGEASDDAVMASWSGLGYYRRARLLHEGAKEVVARYEAVIPEDAEARRSLPGIGAYTAGAIGSIAFDREEPIVDGNVARVLSRFHGIDSALGTRESDKRLWSEAAAWVSGPRPGALNQALMELGATICTLAKPSCDACPLAQSCVAVRENRVASLPVPRVRKAPKPVAWTMIVVWEGERVWLTRGAERLFGSLWSPPTARGHSTEDARAVLSELGIETVELEPCGAFEHVLSHRRLIVHVSRASGRALQERDDLRAFDRDALERVGISKLARRALELGRQ